MADVALINDRLRKIGGLNLHSQPFYRLVWSEDQRVTRWGVYDEFIEGTEIFLRRKEGFFETRKYWNFENRWVLEKWFPAEQIFQKEIPESSRGMYECVYVFEDKDGNALEPIIKVCEMVIHAINNRKGIAQMKVIMDAEENERKKAFMDRAMDSLGKDSDPHELINSLHTGEATGYRGKTNA